jgi:transposase
MGRKRHIVVDTLGLLFGVVVHAADIQDRDGAPAVLASIRRICPWLRHVFADGGCAGPKLRAALDRIGSWTLEIVKRSDHAKGFQLLPRRLDQRRPHPELKGAPFFDGCHQGPLGQVKCPNLSQKAGLMLRRGG